MKQLMAVIGMVLAMSSLASADLIAPPKGRPKEYTFTGTLAREPVQKYAVWLKDDAGKTIVNLGGVPDLPKTVEVEKLIDKKVTVKVMAHETKGNRGAKVILVKSVISINEAPIAKP